MIVRAGEIDEMIWYGCRINRTVLWTGAVRCAKQKIVLAFVIALDETKDLLKSAGYILSGSSKFDIIVVYFLEQRIYNLFEINEVLYAYESRFLNNRSEENGQYRWKVKNGSER